MSTSITTTVKTLTIDPWYVDARLWFEPFPENSWTVTSFYPFKPSLEDIENDIAEESARINRKLGYEVLKIYPG